MDPVSTDEAPLAGATVVLTDDPAGSALAHCLEADGLRSLQGNHAFYPSRSTRNRC